MIKRSCRSVATACVPILLALTLCRCGAASPQNSTPPPPAPSEFLYATAENAILKFTVDPNTGALSNPASTPGPSYTSNGIVTPSYGIVGLPKQGLLYVSDPQNNQVDGFSVNNRTGALTPLLGSPFALPAGGTYPQQLAAHPAGTFLYVSVQNGLSGETDVLTIDSTSGKLTLVSGSPFQDSDNGFIVADPSGKFLYSISGVGINGSIAADVVEQNTGALTPVAGSPFPVPPGVIPCNTLYPCNPISLAPNSAGTTLFVTAYDAFQFYRTVWVISIDAGSGALTFSSLASFQFPEDLSFGAGADFAVSTSGNSVYVSDVHGVHALSFAPATGMLTEVKGSPFPPGTANGGFAVTADGKFLYEASSSSNTISVFAIDPSTGALNPVGSPVPAGIGPLMLTLYKP